MKFGSVLVLFLFMALSCWCCVSAQFEPQVPTGFEEKVYSRDVKCLVCKATIDEMEVAIKKVDPRKKVEVSGFRMDPNGNSVSKSIQYVKSETFLTELMETICSKMEDYAKARYKVSRKLTVLKMVLASGSMNPDMSAVDFVQDGDLNKSLNHYCLEILEDHEETVLKFFMAEKLPADIHEQLCTKTAHYCDDDGFSDDTYLHEDEDRDEL